MEQDFLEILFKHVKGRKVTRKSPKVQALDLTPAPCFTHSALHCEVWCKLENSVTPDCRDLASACSSALLVVTRRAEKENRLQERGCCLG